MPDWRMVPSVGAEKDEIRDRIEQARRACARFVNGHGNRPPSDLLARIPADTRADRYGRGGVVDELEVEVAGLLGKSAAVFFPTRTMAQQIALRVHADRRGRRAMIWHPACHLDWHEGRGYQWLHDLVGVPTWDIREPLTMESLASTAERPAAVLLEFSRKRSGTWLGGSSPEVDLVARSAHGSTAARFLCGHRGLPPDGYLVTERGRRVMAAGARTRRYERHVPVRSL